MSTALALAMQGKEMAFILSGHFKKEESKLAQDTNGLKSCIKSSVSKAVITTGTGKYLVK